MSSTQECLLPLENGNKENIIKVSYSLVPSPRVEAGDGTGGRHWPAASFMAALLPTLLKGDAFSVFELGAGTGFLCKAAMATFGKRLLHYNVQEVPVPDLLQNLARTVSDDKDSSRIRVIPGIWGEESLTEAINGLEAVDYVLLSDCFYAKKNFASLISTLDTLLQAFPQAQVFCAHHQRNDNDSLLLPLLAFNLCAQVVDLDVTQHDQLSRFIRLNKLPSDHFDSLVLIELKRAASESHF